jgi:predicted nucleic acid-binding protein
VPYTLTDCLSFVILRRLGLTTALARDRHFAQEGFVLVP